MTLLHDLPPELLLQVFYSLPSFDEAVNISFTSHYFHRFFQLHCIPIYLRIAPRCYAGYHESIALIEARSRFQCSELIYSTAPSSPLLTPSASREELHSASSSLPLISTTSSPAASLYNTLLSYANVANAAARIYENDMDSRLPWWYTEAMRFLDFSSSPSSKHGTQLKPSERERFTSLLFSSLLLAAYPSHKSRSKEGEIYGRMTLRKLCLVQRLVRWIVHMCGRQMGPRASPENNDRGSWKLEKVLGFETEKWVEVLGSVNSIMEEKTRRLGASTAVAETALGWKEPVGDHCACLWRNWPEEV